MGSISLVSQLPPVHKGDQRRHVCYEGPLGGGRWAAVVWRCCRSIHGGGGSGRSPWWSDIYPLLSEGFACLCSINVTMGLHHDTHLPANQSGGDIIYLTSTQSLAESVLICECETAQSWLMLKCSCVAKLQARSHLLRLLCLLFYTMESHYVQNLLSMHE